MVQASVESNTLVKIHQPAEPLLTSAGLVSADKEGVCVHACACVCGVCVCARLNRIVPVLVLLRIQDAHSRSRKPAGLGAGTHPAGGATSTPPPRLPAGPALSA